MPERLDFKQIAQDIDVEVVAQMLGLSFTLKNGELRAPCPACRRGGDRAIELKPETNTFICYVATPPAGKKNLSGDCIALYAHINGYSGMYRAAKELSEHFSAPASAGRTAPSTAPQAGRAETTAPKKKETVFDAVAFAAKLSFTDEVAALGILEADATRLGVGFYRGRVYFPMRHPDGTVAGFIGFADGELKLPKTWLPSNVVPFQKRA
jgi:hypothetical protein